jgi:hypothetical protein
MVNSDQLSRSVRPYEHHRNANVTASCRMVRGSFSGTDAIASAIDSVLFLGVCPIWRNLLYRERWSCCDRSRSSSYLGSAGFWR